MINKKISVVMAVYNGDKYLAETIDSILSQTLREFEIIIINDGSTDSTLKIARAYKKKDKRIIIINNKQNIGFIKSLNKGLHAAKGKYIARMDADDICMPERFSIQYDFMEKNQDIFLAGTYAININEAGKKLSLFKPPTTPEKIEKILMKKNCMYHNTIIFRNTKKIFYRKKMLYTEDTDLYLNCLTQGKKLANIPEFLVKYRRIANSTSFSKKAKQILFSKKAREFYVQRITKGKDKYDLFNPDSILKLKEITDKDALREEINAHFATNNQIMVRKSAKKYFKYHGIINNPKIIVYYLSSYINVKIINIIKKIIQILKRKY